METIQQTIETVLTARDERAAVFNRVIADTKELEKELGTTADTIKNEFNQALSDSENSLSGTISNDFVQRLDQAQQQFNSIAQTLSQGDLQTAPRAINEAFENLLETLQQGSALEEFAQTGAVSLLTTARAAQSLEQQIDAAALKLARELNPEFDKLSEEQRQLAQDNALELINDRLREIGQSADQVQQQYEELAEAQERVASNAARTQARQYREELTRTGRSAIEVARASESFAGRTGNLFRTLLTRLNPVGRAVAFVGQNLKDAAVDEFNFQVQTLSSNIQTGLVNSLQTAAAESSDFQRAVENLRSAVGFASDEIENSGLADRIASAAARGLNNAAVEIATFTGQVLNNVDLLERRIELLQESLDAGNRLVGTPGVDIPGENALGVVEITEALAFYQARLDELRPIVEEDNRQQAEAAELARQRAAAQAALNEAQSQAERVVSASLTAEERINQTYGERIGILQQLIAAAQSDVSGVSAGGQSLEDLTSALTRTQEQQAEALSRLRDRDNLSRVRAAERTASEQRRIAEQAAREEEERQRSVARAYSETTAIIDSLQTDRERIERESFDRRARLERDLLDESITVEREQAITQALVREEENRAQQLAAIRNTALADQRAKIEAQRQLGELTSLAGLQNFQNPFDTVASAQQQIEQQLDQQLRALQDQLDSTVLDIRFNAEIPDAQREALIAEARALAEQTAQEIASAAAEQQRQSAADQRFQARQDVLGSFGTVAGGLAGLAQTSAQAEAQERAAQIAQAEQDLAAAVEDGNQRQIVAAQNRLTQLQRIAAQEDAQNRERFERYQKLQIAIATAAAFSAAAQSAEEAATPFGRIAAYFSVLSTVIGAAQQIEALNIDGGANASAAAGGGSAAGGGGSAASQGQVSTQQLQQQQGNTDILRIESNRPFVFLDELDEWNRNLRRRRGANAPTLETELI